MAVKQNNIPTTTPIVAKQSIPLHSMNELTQPQTKGVQLPGSLEPNAGREGKIGKKEIEKAVATLQKYKDGKAALEDKIVKNEQWYKLRHWELIRSQKDKTVNNPEPTSAWLLNSLLNKHADAMDNFPEPNILPREENDKEDAKKLSSILPVILEQNEYEETYNNNWWYKLKNGMSVTGVFWNNSKQRGLGDIEIKKIDVLNLFWQPGITDIQKSANVFNIELIDNEIIKSTYPFIKDLGQDSVKVAQYVSDDTIDTTDKSIIIDWYYKIRTETGDVLHYCKFVNNEIIYASENDTEYAERGFYDHAMYPFIPDILFPEESTLAGFGYIDIMKSPQLYIDKLNQIIIRNAEMAGKPRYFSRGDGSVNEAEFADFTKTFVHVNGNLGEDSIREIKTEPLSVIFSNILTQKVDELKETSGNRDFSQGGTSSGVTAASAIAALQEAGSKLSRDMIKTSYRSFTKLNYMIIELIRQFYTEPRCFRITGESGEEEFISYSNQNISPENQGKDFGLDLGDRIPLFDVKVRSQKANPFSKMAQNELAKEFYNLGFFDPTRAEQALIAIEMMDFEGKESIKQKISSNSMLMQQLQQMQLQMQQMAQIIDAQNGTTISQGMEAEENGQISQQTTNPVTSNKVTQTNALGAAYQSYKNNTATTAKEKAINVSSPK